MQGFPIVEIDRPELIDLLTEWLHSHNQLDRIKRVLKKLYLPETASAAIEAVDVAQSAYAKALSRLIGDNEGWLMWFVNVNNCGHEGISVPITGGLTLSVQTLRNLAEVIECNRGNPAECERRNGQ